MSGTPPPSRPQGELPPAPLLPSQPVPLPILTEDDIAALPPAPSSSSTTTTSRDASAVRAASAGGERATANERNEVGLASTHEDAGVAATAAVVIHRLPVVHALLRLLCIPSRSLACHAAAHGDDGERGGAGHAHSGRPRL